jgi:ATP-dependent Clp protease ATP-binding subunit ClpA
MMAAICPQIIILTSNLGSDILMQTDSADPETGKVTEGARDAVIKFVQGSYPPELLNR